MLETEGSTKKQCLYKCEHLKWNLGIMSTNTSTLKLDRTVKENKSTPSFWPWPYFLDYTFNVEIFTSCIKLYIDNKKTEAH